MRISAKVWRESARNAARPEATSTMGQPSGASIARSAKRLTGLSSTSRIAGVGLDVADFHSLLRCGSARWEPLAENVKKLRGVDRLGDVPGGARIDARLPDSRPPLSP